MAYDIENGALVWVPDKHAKSPKEIEHPLAGVEEIEVEKVATKKATK